MNIWKMKQALSGIGQDLQEQNNKLQDMYSDTNSDIKAREDQKKVVADLKERFEGLKLQIEEAEKEAKKALEVQKPNVISGKNEAERLISAKAEFIRALIKGTSLSEEAKAVLIAIPTGENGGENFLPTTMIDRLIHEPFTKNPLRGVEGMTNIKGLELPKIAYTLDNDGFITDEQTAREMELEGDKVSFGRFKSKVKASISDTVLHGSDLSLVNYVENALRSGLAAKEKKVSFTQSPVNGEEHMSFYEVGITEVTRTKKLAAIKAAIANLHEDFRENARVVMSYADFVDILEDLNNGSATFYDAPPERIIGKPVIFADSAVDPIVGDFNYAHFNYDGTPIYDTDKDVDAGEYIFVLTAWIDHRILLKSAFRIAVVGEDIPEE